MGPIGFFSKCLTCSWHVLDSEGILDELVACAMDRRKASVALRPFRWVHIPLSQLFIPPGTWSTEHQWSRNHCRCPNGRFFRGGDRSVAFGLRLNLKERSNLTLTKEPA